MVQPPPRGKIRRLKANDVFQDPHFKLRVMKIPSQGAGQVPHAHEFEELVVILGGRGTLLCSLDESSLNGSRRSAHQHKHNKTLEGESRHATVLPKDRLRVKPLAGELDGQGNSKLPVWEGAYHALQRPYQGFCRARVYLSRPRSGPPLLRLCDHVL